MSLQPPARAATLNCPRCGAPASPDSLTCAYCQAALALVGCTRCLGRVFAGARYCQHCGAALEQGAAAAPHASVEAPCPRCPEGFGANLVPRQLGGTSLLECTRCGGTWLDAHSVASLVSERDNQAALATALPGLAVSASSLPKGPEAQVRYLKCPACARLMNRQNFGRRSGVVVDVCRDDGVWFDGGELGAVVAFVLRGGLDEARKQELQEARDEVRRQRDAADGAGAVLGGQAMFPRTLRGSGVSLLDLVFQFLG